MHHRLTFALLLFTAAWAGPAFALPDFLRDPDDGQFDVSDYVLKRRGVLPMPLIVTEPAVGYGGGLALAYFSQSFEERAEAARAAGEPVIPPDISVGMGVKTENGTWAVGAAHMGFWDHDRWRYMGGVGKAELRLDYFSVDGDPRAYRLDTGVLIQQILRRVATGWYMGARYAYASTKSQFDAAAPQDVSARDLDTAIGRLGVVVDYDSRDNIFTPNRGTFFELEAGFARGSFGSDTQHEVASARVFHWFPAGDTVIGIRGDARTSHGDVPFYAEPYIALRGVPAARYQDRSALVAEAEVRWNVTPRWAVVAFGGAGKAYGRRQQWDEAKTVGAGGVGFRYLLARKLGLYAGLDVARGPEEGAIYLTAGSAWR